MILKQINEYTLLSEAIHPVSKEIYKLGDKITVSADDMMYRSNKEYIMEIKTIFTTSDSEYIFISDKEYKDSEYRRRHWASRPMGIYLNEAKRKITNKEISKINEAKRLARQYT
jgi:hypothetical protein